MLKTVVLHHFLGGKCDRYSLMNRKFEQKLYLKQKPFVTLCLSLLLLWINLKQLYVIFFTLSM